MPANVQPAHREDRGRLNSMTDEAREAEARQRASEAAPVKELHAGHAHATTRTRNLARATAAGPEPTRLHEGRGKTQRVSQRATPACTTKAPQHALAGRVANAPGPAAPAGRPARAAAPNATSSRRLRVH